MQVLHQVSRNGTTGYQHKLKEPDAAMTQIAVVTNFTTDQLWGQIECLIWH